MMMCEIKKLKLYLHSNERFICGDLYRCDMRGISRSFLLQSVSAALETGMQGKLQPVFVLNCTEER